MNSMYFNFIIGCVYVCKDNLRDSDGNNMAIYITIELPLEALWLRYVLLIPSGRNFFPIHTRVFQTAFTCECFTFDCLSAEITS